MTITMLLGKIWFCVDTRHNAHFIDFLEKYSKYPVENYAFEKLVDVKCPACFRHKFMWPHPIEVMLEGIDVEVSNITY